MAVLMLILSTGLSFFCLQAVCEKILRRQFAQEHFQSIVDARGHGGSSVTECSSKRPTDFSITYEWHEAAVPPPNYYEYHIVVRPTGQCTFTLIPDYPAGGVPVWNEPFILSTHTLDELYRFFIARGLLSTKWEADSRPRVGGRIETMSITACGKSVKIPAAVIPTQASSVAEMFSVVRNVIPRTAWDKLNKLRQQYLDERSKRKDSSP